MACRALPRCTEKRLAQLRQVFFSYPRPMIAHAEHNALVVAHCRDFDRLPGWVEAQGIAQQVIQRPLDECWPALQAQPVLVMQLNVLLRCTELGILLHRLQHCIQVHRLGPRLFGIDSRQHQDFADQGFQAVAFAGQARPKRFALLRSGPLGQGQGNAQAGQRRAQLMGDVAQQLALTADHALQA
ncbi:hypothetical protein D3C77_507730 [compost metagenome]